MGNPWALELPSSCFSPSGRTCNEETTTEVNPEEGIPDAVVISISLPVDIILEVLTRLPVKTLFRFRCVSKGWCALLSDPAFAAAQRSRAAAADTPLVVGVFGKLGPLEKFDPYRPPRFPRASLELQVIDTADGNFLNVVKDVKSAKLMRTGLDLVFVDQGVHGARVIDPATGRVVTVGGEASIEYPKADCNGIPYDFMHDEFCHSSFGRATPSGAYKVVRLRNAVTALDDGQICQVATIEAASTATGATAEPTTWRQRPEPPILTCCCSSCTATVNGVLHFMDGGANAHGTRPANPGWNHIASFDLESEEWKAMIDGPPTGCPREDETWEMTLAELKNTLSVIQTVWSPYYLGDRDRYTNIWLLVDREKSTWKRECTIQMTKNWCFFEVLEIFIDGRMLMLNAFEIEEEDLYDVRCSLQLYDPTTGSLTDLMKMPEDFRGSMTLYTGSLLS